MVNSEYDPRESSFQRVLFTQPYILAERARVCEEKEKLRTQFERMFGLDRDQSKVFAYTYNLN